ncbi:MAG TPA: hypothetical protein VKG45_10310 [Actinomycetes bacterium]|nr:hypothetical protein [Actinomycetes bacterium]
MAADPVPGQAPSGPRAPGAQEAGAGQAGAKGAAAARPAGDPPAVERFQPGGVLHALVSGLLGLALASLLLGAGLAAGERSREAGSSLLAAALLWAVLALWSLAQSVLRARMLVAELDAGGVTVRGVAGSRRHRYQELSAVRLARGRVRLVTRSGRVVHVRAVRGVAQGRRFRERLLSRAAAAAGSGPDRLAGNGGAGATGPRPPSLPPNP